MAKDKWIEDRIPPWRQILGWAEALQQARMRAEEDRLFPSVSAKEATLKEITRQIDSMQVTLAAMPTDCPECADLFCHLGNRDLEVRALQQQISEQRSKLALLGAVHLLLTRYGIPQNGPNGHELSLVNRIKMLAERTHHGSP